MARKVKEPKEKKVKNAKRPKKEPKPLESCGSRIIGNPVRVLVILAVISAVIGVALFQFYDAYKNYFDYMIGGLVILIGVISIVFYFAKRMIDGVYRSEFAIGVLCIAFGAYVALNGGASFSFLVIIGAMCAFDGVIKLQYTLDLARMRFKAWWLPLILSLLGIAIGVVILMGLFGELFGEGEGASMTGLALCANALFDIVCAIVIAVRNHKSKKAKKLAESQPMVSVVTESEPEAETPAEEPEVEVEITEMDEAAPEDAPVVESSESAEEAPDDEAAQTDAEPVATEDAAEPEAELTFPAEPVEAEKADE